jgi:DNA phosphorothioation-dependent restriction protein DptH
MSNWVVFVDPKVDLTFFKRTHKDGSKLMIIHYSDQYSSTSGYAIAGITDINKNAHDNNNFKILFIHSP